MEVFVVVQFADNVREDNVREVYAGKTVNKIAVEGNC